MTSSEQSHNLFTYRFPLHAFIIVFWVSIVHSYLCLWVSFSFPTMPPKSLQTNQSQPTTLESLPKILPIGSNNCSFETNVLSVQPSSNHLTIRFKYYYAVNPTRWAVCSTIVLENMERYVWMCLRLSREVFGVCLLEVFRRNAQRFSEASTTTIWLNNLFELLMTV